MKATGVTRKVDDLGRVCLPVEIRRSLGIDVGDPLEVFVDRDTIVLKRHNAVDSVKSVAERLKSMVEGVKNPRIKAEMYKMIGEILEETIKQKTVSRAEEEKS